MAPAASSPRSTRVERRIDAPRARVYAALLDPAAIARWRVPHGMSCVVHEWDAREGGALRVSLTYEDRDGVGKSGARTDTYHGRFRRLLADTEVVEVVEFETDDPSLRGAMTTTIRLADAGAATALTATHDGVPPGISLADNETGWRMALDNLAALVEHG